MKKKVLSLFNATVVMLCCFAPSVYLQSNASGWYYSDVSDWARPELINR